MTAGRGAPARAEDRDARVLGIGGGTTEIMNEIIARHLDLDPA